MLALMGYKHVRIVLDWKVGPGALMRLAIIPSIAYAFLVAPCSENDLACWDRFALNTIEERYKLWQCTATAILREDKINFGLRCTSIAIGYHVRCAAALTTSLNNIGRHGQVSSDTTFSGASTHRTTILTSSSSNYPICSMLGKTSASTSALSTSPIKHPTFFPASLPY
eukprot:1139865-Pelagomonas_calceolata.AAC.12